MQLKRWTTLWGWAGLLFSLLLMLAACGEATATPPGTSPVSQISANTTTVSQTTSQAVSSAEAVTTPAIFTNLVILTALLFMLFFFKVQLGFTRSSLIFWF